MKIAEALPSGTRVFLDTAPLVYFVERVSPFFPTAKAIFDQIDQGHLSVVTSPVTLAECLVAPVRAGNKTLEQLFVNLITTGPNTLFVEINELIASRSASLRARYNLALLDAMQFAVAITTGCDTFLTNDARLQRVSEIRVLMLDKVMT